MEISKRISNNSDGNCLFNCVAAFLDKSLYNCKRHENGLPQSKNYKEKEKLFASNLRKIVCFRMNDMHTELKDMCEFDDEYTNLDERIVDMKKNKVWGGMPEIKVLSEILKVTFNIYVPLEDNYVNKISKIGEYKRTCNLLLDFSHYELIEFAENKVFSFVENDINDNIDTNENQTVIKARLIKNEEIDGYLIKNINKEYLETLGLLSDNNHNGKYIENLNSWFFHDNFKGYKDFCDQNNIPFIN